MIEDVLSLLFDTAASGHLRRATFSRPENGDGSRISARLCTHKGELLFATERKEKGGKVYHKNIPLSALEAELPALASPYLQINLSTALGDAEYKRSAKGKEVFLGGDKLRRAHAAATPSFADALTETLDAKKNYILSGDEPFLLALGISDARGRVHDKKQAKFRQINRFLEHVRDIERYLPDEGPLLVYDLCCGKSYLSFAVYHYLTEIKGRRVYLYGADLKRDVILWCESLAKELGYVGMRFEVGDISKIVPDEKPDMVISLHACDIATDIVLDTAIRLGAEIILSTPCCHRYLNGKVVASELDFITRYPHLSGKLCEAITDALRLARLRANGYNVMALELTDPENTPKNTLIKAIKNTKFTEKERQSAESEYKAMLSFLLGDNADKYLSEIKD